MEQFLFSGEDIITFDVAGTIIKTSISTINNRPGTMLNSMFANKLLLKFQPDGSVFIDEDPNIFKMVLQAHRMPTVSLRSIFRGMTEDFRQQIVDYWGLVPMEQPTPEHNVSCYKQIQTIIMVKFITSIKNHTDFINCLLYNELVNIVTDPNKRIYYGPSESEFVYESKWLESLSKITGLHNYDNLYQDALNQCGLKIMKIIKNKSLTYVRCILDALNTQTTYCIPNNTVQCALTYQQIHTELSEIFIEQYIKKADSLNDSYKYNTGLKISFTKNHMMTASFGLVHLYNWLQYVFHSSRSSPESNENVLYEDIFEKALKNAGIHPVTIFVSETELSLNFSN